MLRPDVRRRGLHLLLLTVLAACGRAPSTSPQQSPPPDPLPAITTEIRILDREDLARDAIDRDELLALLERARFVSATERFGSARPEGLDRLSVRVVSFEEPGGATAFLDWLLAHVTEVIGDAEQLEDLELRGIGDVPLFRHAPGDCCPKDSVAFLAAWRRDATVTWLELAGSAVDRASFARAADASVT